MAKRPVEPPKKDLVKSPGGALSTDRPAYIPRGNAGLEDSSSQDFMLPRIAMCNAMSPQRSKTEARYIQGLEEGQMFNTLTNEVYGSEIRAILLKMMKQRIKFHLLESGGGIHCQSPNSINGGHLSKYCSECPHSMFQQGEDGSSNPPECFLIYSYPTLLIKDGVVREDMAALSFKSASTKVARQLNTLVRVKNAPIFAGVYKISAVVDTGAGQKFWNFKVEPDGWLPKETYDLAFGYYESLKTANVRVHEEDDASFDTSELERDI